MESKTLTLSLIRSSQNGGYANICAGCAVDTKIAFSPAGSGNVDWWTEWDIYWENEFSGHGTGSLKATAEEKKLAAERKTELALAEVG